MTGAAVTPTRWRAPRRRSSTWRSPRHPLRPSSRRAESQSRTAAPRGSAPRALL